MAPLPVGRSKSLSVPEILVVETELMPLWKPQVFPLRAKKNIEMLFKYLIHWNAIYNNRPPKSILSEQSLSQNPALVLAENYLI